MKRPFWAYLLVFTLLGAFGGFTYLTRNPEAEILRRAESWPYVGPLAARFRAAYLPRTERPGGEPETEETRLGEDTGRIVPPPPPRQFQQYVWALGGMELKRSAAPEAETIYRFENLARAGKIERRGDWFHVYYHGREGWVLLEGYDEDAEVPYGNTPEPTRPVPARPPEEERLAAARQYLRGKERVAPIGSYTLYTDYHDDELITYLDTVVKQLDAAYAERYGRRPLGDPAEAVVLYRSDIAYRLMQRQTPRLAGLTAAGHNSEGVAVLYSGSRSPRDVTRTVIHELTHFTNRRAVGPQLPPWLDEGIADDIAHGRIDEDGRLHPADLGGERLQRGDEVRLEGGYAALWRLREAARSGTLPELPGLMRSDWDAFVKTPKVQLHYDAASLWVRFLLEGDGGRWAHAFRSFLGAVAEGGPATAEALGVRLGEEWSVLDDRFRAWIEERAARAQLPPAAG